MGMGFCLGFGRACASPAQLGLPNLLALGGAWVDEAFEDGPLPRLAKVGRRGTRRIRILDAGSGRVWQHGVWNTASRHKISVLQEHSHPDVVIAPTLRCPRLQCSLWSIWSCAAKQ